jgi:putative tryptophan/tyrosine transport system substrate-binding protein
MVFMRYILKMWHRLIGTVLLGCPWLSLAIPVVGITMINQHASLMQTKMGIVKALEAHGYVADRTVRIISNDAQGSMVMAAVLAKQWVARQPNVIIAITTPSAQTIKTALGASSTIPFVFAAVSNPMAAGLIQHNPLWTGTTDMPPVNELLAMIHHLLPWVKRVGVLYNPSEINAYVLVRHLIRHSPIWLTIVPVPVQQAQQVGTLVRHMSPHVDVWYAPSDNTVFSALSAVMSESQRQHKPVFVNDPDAVRMGALACVGYTQFNVGYTAGLQAVRLLQGERHVPVQIPTHRVQWVRQDVAKKLGLVLSDFPPSWRYTL